MIDLQANKGRGKAANKTYYRIQPYVDGRRITIRLGTGQKKAEAAAKAISDLIESRHEGIDLNGSTRKWLEDTAEREICEKLVGYGLLEQLPRRYQKSDQIRISDLSNLYIKVRCSGLEPSTIVVHEKAKKNLIECFGDLEIGYTWVGW